MARSNVLDTIVRFFTRSAPERPSGFKPFFVHKDYSSLHKEFAKKKIGNMRTRHGFTAYVTPYSDTTCALQVTFLSHKDKFCRRTGRDEAMMKPMIFINKRDVPLYISQFDRMCGITYTTEQDYYYLYKNFI